MTTAIQVKRILYLLRLGRPVFLVGGFVFHGLGVVMAVYQGAHVSLPVLLWGQLTITAVQLMTHFSNDYFDLPADLANLTPTLWSGGSRILPHALLPSRYALVTALLLAAFAITSTLVLEIAHDPGPLAMPMLFLALLLAWAYSSPPLRLHSTGLGELTVAFLVPGLTTLIGFYLQMGELTWLPLLAAIPLCCFQFTMIMAINFPDAAGDAAVGKRTLVVRLGGARSAKLYIASILAAYLLLPWLVWWGLPAQVGIAISLSAPVGVWQIWRMRRGAWHTPRTWDSLGTWSIGLLVGSAVLEIIAFASLL